MLSFDNTKIAFKYKSNADLTRAYWLFRLISSNLLVIAVKTFTNAALGMHLPIAWAIKPTLYKHFVGGETIEECAPTVRLLENYNVKSILDYSVEGGKGNETIERTIAETLRTIVNASTDVNIPFAVFKPTAFASAEVMEKASSSKVLSPEIASEAEKFKQRVVTICRLAYEKGGPVMIDAEDSWYQSFVDDVITEMMENYNKMKSICKI